MRPICRGHQLVTILRAEVIVCDPVHRDLNVRNFLVDGAGNIHVIDFSSLKEGPLVTDFTRLECEILLKLTLIDDLPSYVGLCRKLVETGLVEGAARLSAGWAEGPLGTTLRLVATIRRIAADYVREARSGNGYDFENDYLGGLAATSGRV